MATKKSVEINNPQPKNKTKLFFDYLGYLGILVGVVGIILLLLKIITGEGK